MKHRTIVFSGLLSVFVTASAAQEPSDRINLDVISNSPISTIVVARISFAERDSKCPDDHQTLRISEGRLAWVKSSTESRPPTRHWRATIMPLDDDTQAYRIESQDCRMDIAVREQVQRDGSWVSLLVPKQQRPSLPPEERRELQRQFMENLRAPEESMPSSRDWVDRWKAATKEMRAWSSPAGTVRWAFAFEDKPQTCFEAVGDLYIESSAIRFLFLTGLPGDLNRFVIERTNLGANRQRLYFSRGDCRFELTASQSILRDGAWVSVPLAPTAPPKE
jgi:hypothetical protein